MINSRKIEDLHPVLQEKAKAIIAACSAKGIKIIITSTLRDDEYQATLYAKGRADKSSGIVTMTEVTGAHGVGLAFDVVPVVAGKAVYTDDKSWDIIGSEGRSLGLTWGGNWKGFTDKPHFEMTEGLTRDQLRVGKRPSWFYPQPLEEWERILMGAVDRSEDWIDWIKDQTGIGKYLPSLIVKVYKSK